MVPSVTASDGRPSLATRQAVEDAEHDAGATTIGTAIQIGRPKAENFEKITAPKASVEASDMSISPRMTMTARPSARMPG